MSVSHTHLELETVILSVDPERERISLGIKQLEDDPFSNYVSLNDKGTIVRGVVKEVDAKGAIIDPVSYTHLDVYKRQGRRARRSS